MYGQQVMGEEQETIVIMMVTQTLVGAVDNNNVQSFYSEPCASLLVVAPSSNYPTNPKIVTTDLTGSQGVSTGDCATSFGGTSAAAPMVAGLVALILDANSNLNWLDVQGVLIYSSTKVSSTDPDWIRNGAGLYHSHKYGFGKVNAQNAVETAKTWINLPTEKSWRSDTTSVYLPPTNLRREITVPENFTITWVEVILWASVPKRGELSVIVQSPHGTQSILAERHNDGNPNYNNWRFTTVRNWGEYSAGAWTLIINTAATTNTGTVVGWQLFVYGY